MFVSEQLFLVLLSIKCRPVLVIEHCLLCLRFHANVYIYILPGLNLMITII